MSEQDEGVPMVRHPDGSLQGLAEWVRGEELQVPDPTFTQELEQLLNRHCVENESNTPDFILAAYLRACLDAWNEGVRARDAWYSIAPRPGWQARLDELEAPQ